MALVTRILSDERVKTAIIFIIGLVAEYLIGIVDTVGSVPTP